MDALQHRRASRQTHNLCHTPLPAPALAVRAQGSRQAVQCVASAAQPVHPASKYHVLQYSYVPDILEKRTPHRAEHLEAVTAKAKAGKVVMAGAVGETPEGAIVIFKNTSVEEIQQFVADDPYVKNGLVPSWSIKPWAVVVDTTEL